MKKIVIASLLSLALVVPASAVACTTTYDNHFSDLTTDSVFYENVVALYEYGLSVGKSDGTYDLTGELTVGEAVIFGARIRSLLTTGDAETAVDAYRTDGQSIYDPYYAYLQDQTGLSIDTNIYAPATRGEMAHILVLAMPAEAVSAINQDAVTQGYALGTYITDVDEYTPYYSDILTLYKWGISAGYDATGSYGPANTVTRGAASAFVTRLVDEDLRITLDWTTDTSLANSAQGTTLGDLVTPGAYMAAPTTEAELDQVVRYMLSQNTNVLELQYSSLTTTKASQYSQSILSIVKSYCEQNYNGVSVSYSTNGYMELVFGWAGEDMEDVSVYREAFMEDAIAIHDALWNDGTLYAGMTQEDIAWVYYQWICENVAYDYSAGDASIVHLPYNALAEGVAVCDGYTGAYNVFLKLEGIECYALSNASHIWTVAVLDGTEVHIDATWGDKGDTGSTSYFAMTPEQSYRYHSW